MQSPRRFMLIFWVTVLLLSSVACNLLAGRVTPTPTAPPTSTPPASSLEERVEESRSQFEGLGRFEFTVTESELTDLAARELSQQADNVLTEPQILLRDGQITILGTVTQAGFSMPAEIKLQPMISGDGDLRVEVISMNVGPFAVPQQMSDQVSSLANDLVARQLSEAGNIRVESITIQDGVLTVAGSKR